MEKVVLKSSLEFGKKIKQMFNNGIIDVYGYFDLRSNYDSFLEQILELWMFVPAKIVNGVWVVLEEPEEYENWITKNIHDPHWTISVECKEYQEAKESVLFEGFEIDKENSNNELTYFFYNKDTFRFYFYDDGLYFGSDPIGIKTIEGLMKYNEFPVLTESAKKQIGI